MKNKLPYLFLPIAALASVTALASGQEGHGGNAVVCFDDSTTAPKILAESNGKTLIPDSALSKIVSIQTLDLYEAQQMGGLETEKPKLLEPLQHETYRDYLERIWRRFQYSIPLLGREIEIGLNRVLNRVSIYGTERESSGIAQAFDLGSLPYVIDTTHCVIATVARQSGSRAAGTLRVDIDGRLLNHPMNSDFSRKVLLLHEVIYAWALERGDTDSQATRFLVSKLIQKELLRSDVIDALVDYKFAERGDSGLVGETFYQSEVEREIRNAAAPILALMGGRNFEEFSHSPEVAEPYARMESLRQEIGLLNAAIYDLDLKIRQEVDPIVRENLLAEKAKKLSLRGTKTTEFTWSARQVQLLDAKKAEIVNAFRNARASLFKWTREELAPRLDLFAQGQCFGTSVQRQNFEERVGFGLEDYLKLSPPQGRPVERVDAVAPYCDAFLIRLF